MAFSQNSEDIPVTLLGGELELSFLESADPSHPSEALHDVFNPTDFVSSAFEAHDDEMSYYMSPTWADGLMAWEPSGALSVHIVI